MSLVQWYDTNVINLHNRWRLGYQELKPEICIIGGVELYQVVIENTRWLVAGIDGAHSLVVNHNTHKTFRWGTFVEICSES